MDVLGVDPSLTMTGLAKTTEAGVTLVQRVSSVKTNDVYGIRDRVRYIVGQTLRFAPARCLTVIEAPIVMRNGAGGAQLERAWLFGMLVDQLVLRGPVILVRTTTRAKYAAGAGNADKKAVLAAVREAFPLLPVRDDNVADALALCAMGARHLGAPIDGVPTKNQLAAMTAVAWTYPKGTK
jgi:Holliday junction resolvasome RuvABC endonuclease subunit